MSSGICPPPQIISLPAFLTARSGRPKTLGSSALAAAAKQRPMPNSRAAKPGLPRLLVTRHPRRFVWLIAMRLLPCWTIFPASQLLSAHRRASSKPIARPGRAAANLEPSPNPTAGLRAAENFRLDWKTSNFLGDARPAAGQAGEPIPRVRSADRGDKHSSRRFNSKQHVLAKPHQFPASYRRWGDAGTASGPE